jgi:hypothetical protein
VIKLFSSILSIVTVLVSHISTVFFFCFFMYTVIRHLYYFISSTLSNAIGQPLLEAIALSSTVLQI